MIYANSPSLNRIRPQILELTLLQIQAGLDNNIACWSSKDGLVRYTIGSTFRRASNIYDRKIR